ARKMFRAVDFKRGSRITPLGIGKDDSRPLLFFQHRHDFFHAEPGGPALEVIGGSPARTALDITPRGHAHQNVLVTPKTENKSRAKGKPPTHHSYCCSLGEPT